MQQFNIATIKLSNRVVMLHYNPFPNGEDSGSECQDPGALRLHVAPNVDGTERKLPGESPRGRRQFNSERLSS